MHSINSQLPWSRWSCVLSFTSFCTGISYGRFGSGSLLRPSSASAAASFFLIVFSFSSRSLRVRPTFARSPHIDITTSFVGRFFGVLWPIAGFVAIGLEHSVANMCFFPIAIALGAPVTWGAVWMANLIPVTLGNMVSGFLVALTLTSAYKEQ